MALALGPALKSEDVGSLGWAHSLGAGTRHLLGLQVNSALLCLPLSTWLA